MFFHDFYQLKWCHNFKKSHVVKILLSANQEFLRKLLVKNFKNRSNGSAWSAPERMSFTRGRIPCMAYKESSIPKEDQGNLMKISTSWNTKTSTWKKTLNF